MCPKTVIKKIYDSNKQTPKNVENNNTNSLEINECIGRHNFGRSVKLQVIPPSQKKIKDRSPCSITFLITYEASSFRSSSTSNMVEDQCYVPY
jgi:hypothetical protein